MNGEVLKRLSEVDWQTDGVSDIVASSGQIVALSYDTVTKRCSLIVDMRGYDECSGMVLSLFDDWALRSLVGSYVVQDGIVTLSVESRAVGQCCALMVLQLLRLYFKEGNMESRNKKFEEWVRCVNKLPHTYRKLLPLLLLGMCNRLHLMKMFTVEVRGAYEGVRKDLGDIVASIYGDFNVEYQDNQCGFNFDISSKICNKSAEDIFSIDLCGRQVGKGVWDRYRKICAENSEDDTPLMVLTPKIEELRGVSSIEGKLLGILNILQEQGVHLKESDFHIRRVCYI